MRHGDTLRKIAAQFKPDQATLDQMLDALFRGNPAAFEGENMNRLRAGAIVTIPTAAQVQAISPEEATHVVHVQATDWRNYRDRIAAAAPATGAGATREASGRIGVAVEDKTPAGAPGSDKLEVSREATAGKSAVSEDRIARSQELKDAETRIAQLEKTVAEMQQALDLKNQTLAQLQSQAEAAKGGAPAAAAATAAGAAPAAPPRDSRTRHPGTGHDWRRRRPRRHPRPPRPRSLPPRRPSRRRRRGSSPICFRTHRTGRSAQGRWPCSAGSPG